MEPEQNTNDDHPLVSVIVPLYNGGGYIERTLQSILSQTYPHLEIIIVDDGSADDGPAKVAAMSEQHSGRIRLLTHPDRGNHGIAASRNLAIRNSRGAYIAFIDQDDLWTTIKLQKEVGALSVAPEAGFVYAQCRFIDDQGAESASGFHGSTGGKGIPGAPRNIFYKLIKENFIPTLTMLVRKSCFDRIGVFDEGPRFEYEDWILFSKLAYYYKAVFIAETLSLYRIHSGNYSAHISDIGLLYYAEEHYTVSLFSFLLSRNDVSRDDVRRLLRRRVMYFFLRARSWNVPAVEMSEHLKVLVDQFPSERRIIRNLFHAVMMIPPGVTSVVRRVRRALIGT